jgi:hypothetical protein
MRATDGTGTTGHTQPQHVWIDLSSGRYPGLLLEWVKDGATAWRGRVIWSEREGHSQQDTLAAQQISPWERPGNQP